MDSLFQLMQSYYQRNVPTSLSKLLGTTQTQAPGSPTSQAPVQKPAKPASPAPVGGANAKVSDVGKMLNSFSSSLAGNEPARKGLRDLVMETGRSGGVSKLGEFALPLKELQTADRKTFQNFFSAVGSVADAGNPVMPFVRTTNSLSGNAEGQKAFVNAIGGISAATTSNNTSRSDVISDTLSSVNAITKKTAGQTLKDTLKEFLDGVSSAAKLEEKETFIQAFQKKNPTIFGT